MKTKFPHAEARAVTIQIETITRHDVAKVDCIRDIEAVRKLIERLNRLERRAVRR